LVAGSEGAGHWGRSQRLLAVWGGAYPTVFLDSLMATLAKSFYCLVLKCIICPMFAFLSFLRLQETIKGKTICLLSTAERRAQEGIFAKFLSRS
jgi:hypothetical protein